MHLPALISDLAVILLAAGFITLIFKAIKQPVVLGYILAGIVAGPHLDIFGVAEIESIEIWAKIGVIFLLFSLGLDFSFKKLLHVGGTAVITAITVVVAMLTLGYFTGKLLGWSHINSLFLGGMLSMSSTTIIIKSFDDLGLRNQLFAGLVIGILVVEDLVAVIMMVLLSTISNGTDIDSTEVIMSVIRLFMFVLIWFVMGIYLLPTFFKKTKKWMNQETMLVVTLALCFGMVLLATKIGFSEALGAFVMGSLLAETIEAERIESLTRPVKDFFGAIFFVSVGMMIDPLMLGQYWMQIMVISIVVIGGQITFGSIGMVLSGQPLRTSLQAGFSLAQVGEFAFIIATLGLSLGVTDPSLYPIIVAVSVITTFLTPFFIKMSEPAYQKLIHTLSPETLKRLHSFSISSKSSVNSKGAWSELMKDMTRVVGVYLAITITIMFLSFYYVVPAIDKLKWGLGGNILSAFLIILAMAPFLRAIMVKKNRTIRMLMSERNMNKAPLIALVLVRIIVCVGLVMFVVERLFDLGMTVVSLISISVISFTIFSQWLKRGSIQIEHRFLSNLTERQSIAEKKNPLKKEFVHHLMARDIHLADFEIKPHSHYVGKALKDIHMRQSHGINVVSILRGEERINIPNGEIRLYPYDKIVVVGTDKQLMRFSYIMEDESQLKHIDAEKEPVHLEQLLLDENSTLIGKTIATAHLRDKHNCMVIGIERARSSTMNPDIDEAFKLGDVVWLVGERAKIIALAEAHTRKKRAHKHD